MSMPTRAQVMQGVRTMAIGKAELRRPVPEGETVGVVEEGA